MANTIEVIYFRCIVYLFSLISIKLSVKWALAKVFTFVLSIILKYSYKEKIHLIWNQNELWILNIVWFMVRNVQKTAEIEFFYAYITWKVKFVLEPSTRAHFIDNFILIQINEQTIYLKLLTSTLLIIFCIKDTFSAYCRICHFLASVVLFKVST